MINVWWQKSLYLVGDKTNIPCFYAQNNTKVAGAISPEQYLLDSQAYQYKYPWLFALNKVHSQTISFRTCNLHKQAVFEESIIC